MIMANGSILVMGGETGQNADEQPNLELLPRSGGGVLVNLPFLQRTAPFNLYPFLFVLPSGIFVLYYNEAVILDEKTFATIKQLPNLPGAVNDPTGGRTYQLQGSMVALPQHAPFTDPVGVLACGGSTSNGGYAIDNCVSTYPEAANPTWTIERMVSPASALVLSISLTLVSALKKSHALHGRSPRRYLHHLERRPARCRRIRSCRIPQLQCSSV